MAQEKHEKKHVTKGNWVENKRIPYNLKWDPDSDLTEELKNIPKIFDNHHCIFLELDTGDKIAASQPGQSQKQLKDSDIKPSVNEGNEYMDDDIHQTSGNIDDDPKVSPTPEGVKQVINASQLPFYQHIDKILVKIGCKAVDQSAFFTKAYKHSVSNMTAKINVSGGGYKLLSTMKSLDHVPHPKQHDEKKQDKDDEFEWRHMKSAKFTLKLDYDYKKWMMDGKVFASSLQTELSSILKLDPSLIEIGGDVRKGSVIIDFWVLNVWIPYYMQNFVADNPMPIPYNMRPQDQIKVKYDTCWYNATIMDIRDFTRGDGINFKVHYNKIQGNAAFTFKNTEWFYSIKQAQRICFPDGVVVSFSNTGARITTRFSPPPLAPVTDANSLNCGHHIFVFRDGMWHRCEVIETRNTFEGKKIQVTYLDYIFYSNDEWLKLWEQSHVQRISFRDRRVYV